jgi:predicted Zn-dependent protease
VERKTFLQHVPIFLIKLANVVQIVLGSFLRISSYESATLKPLFFHISVVIIPADFKRWTMDAEMRSRPSNMDKYAAEDYQ